MLEATRHVDLSAEERQRYLGMVESVAIKLLYACFWQEFVLGIDTDWLAKPVVNVVGTRLLPVLNGFANSLQVRVTQSTSRVDPKG